MVDGRRLCRRAVHYVSRRDRESECGRRRAAGRGVHRAVRRRLLLVRRLLPVLAGVPATHGARVRAARLSAPYFARVAFTSESGRYLPSAPANSASAVYPPAAIFSVNRMLNAGWSVVNVQVSPVTCPYATRALPRLSMVYAWYCFRAGA